MKYKHTQKGYLILYVLLAVVALFGFVAIKTEFNLIISITMFFVLFILASFSSLSIIVDDKIIRVKFGYGIFRKTFVLKQIASVKTVKNHWYYGWGIRLWLWPMMWVYNVSGFDAVEITLKNGRKYRIGTDEPEKLKQVILKSK